MRAHGSIWALLGLLLATPANAQVTLSGAISISGEMTVGPGIAGPVAGECDLPLSFAGNQGTNCIRKMYKPTTWDERTNISFGADPGQQKLTTDCDAAGCGNIVAAIPPGTVAAPGSHPGMIFLGSLAGTHLNYRIGAYNPGGVGSNLYGDGTTCTEVSDYEIDGRQCYGVAVLITEGANQGSTASCSASDGGAYAYLACEGKGTDEAWLDRVNLCSGARTNLVTSASSPVGAWDVYGGTIPPANCDHNRGQADWHMNCQWVEVCLTIAQGGGNITFTGTVKRIGKASGWAKGDPENADPGPPSGTTAYTRTTIMSTSHGPITRASNINATGLIGCAASGLNGTTLEGACTNLRTTP